MVLYEQDRRTCRVIAHEADAIGRELAHLKYKTGATPAAAKLQPVITLTVELGKWLNLHIPSCHIMALALIRRPYGPIP